MKFVDCIAVGESALRSQWAASFTSNDQEYAPQPKHFQKFGLCAEWMQGSAYESNICMLPNQRSKVYMLRILSRDPACTC
jgi:hypothetical protein